MKLNFLYFFILLIGFACTGSNSDQKPDIEKMNQLTADEVVQSSQYTFIKSVKGDTEQWFAVPSAQVIKGMKYYYEGGREMKNFESKELNRVFENMILLVELFSKDPVAEQKPAASGTHHHASVNTEKIRVQMDPAPGGISIAELMENRKKYKNKSVIVKGIVTKFNPAIMNTNWVHIQDGTDYDKFFDLTLTTDENVRKGDTITFKGKIALDKDFGYGYFYNVLMEQGEIVE